MDQPSGEEELQQHTLALLGFNRIREHLYTALASFREQVSGADAGQICTALANLLEALKVRESLNRMIEELKEEDDRRTERGVFGRAERPGAGSPSGMGDHRRDPAADHYGDRTEQAVGPPVSGTIFGGGRKL